MLPQDIFLRLPRPTALLLLSSLLDLTSAHLARQTPTTIPYRPLNVAAYPPLPAPTSPPLDLQALNELLRRQDTSTVCGYINGDASLPATCSAGSHCVVDTDHNVVGCCPDGEDTCTAGVYTGCVDSNSGPQTELNPYVFTCTGGNVCYKNMFEGGNSQWGCGTASDLAATVAASASGGGSGVSLTTEDVSFTQTPTTLASPTTLGTNTQILSSATSFSSSSSSSSSSSPPVSSDLTTITIPSPATISNPSSATVSPPKDTSTAASTSTSTSTPTSAPGTSSGGSGGGVNRTGAIVGGSIAGAAALVGLVAIAAYFLRRRTGNTRQGPGPRPGDTQYISPMSGGGAAFAPLGQSPNGGGSGSGGSSDRATVGGKTITHITGEPDSRNTVWQYGDMGGHQDSQFVEHRPADWGMGGGGGGAAAAAGAGVGAGAGAAFYRGAYASPYENSGEDEIPLRPGSPEIEDFSRGFHDALSRIGEEDEEDLEDEVNGAGMSGNIGNNGDLGDNSRPLWLQSRRQSRNLMWT